MFLNLYWNQPVCLSVWLYVSSFEMQTPPTVLLLPYLNYVDTFVMHLSFAGCVFNRLLLMVLGWSSLENQKIFLEWPVSVKALVRINSLSVTGCNCFNNGYAGKQPVALKGSLAKKW